MSADAWIWALCTLVGVFALVAIGRALRRQPHRTAIERKAPGPRRRAR